MHIEIFAKRDGQEIWSYYEYEKPGERALGGLVDFSHGRDGTLPQIVEALRKALTAAEHQIETLGGGLGLKEANAGLEGTTGIVNHDIPIP